MTCSASYCLYDTLMDQWNVCMYINSITYAINTFKFSFYPFQTFTTHCHWFCFRCGCLCSVFLAMFSWYAVDSYLTIIIWSAALKRFELIYYLIPFHDFSIFNHFFMCMVKIIGDRLQPCHALCWCVLVLIYFYPIVLFLLLWFCISCLWLVATLIGFCLHSLFAVRLLDIIGFPKYC
jgi:hypothetical protein